MAFLLKYGPQTTQNEPIHFSPIINLDFSYPALFLLLGIFLLMLFIFIAVIFYLFTSRKSSHYFYDQTQHQHKTCKL